MATALFSYTNAADSGTYSEVNVSPQEWTDSLPLSNLSDRQLTKVARTLSTSADFLCTLDRLQTITFIALLGHNLTVNGQWRVQIFTDAALSNEVYDSGYVDVWNTTESPNSLPWGSFSWNGKQLTDNGNNAILTLDSVVGRYVLVSLTDSGNSSGYLQAGRFIVDAPWRPTYSMQFGWGLRYSARSQKSRTRGGQVWSDRVTEHRILNVTFSGLSKNEAFGITSRIDRLKGITGDVLVIQDPADLVNLSSLSIYGTLASAEAAAQRTHNDFTHSFTIEESK